MFSYIGAMKHSNRTIARNIKHLRSLKKLSQEELADKLNITRARLGAYEEDRNEPPAEILIKISDFFHVAIDALLKADLSKTDLKGLMNIGKNRLLFPIAVDKEGNDLVEVIPVKAQAGYVAGYSDPLYISKLPVMHLPFLPTGKHRAFSIRGDSMPPLKTNDYVVGKYVESIHDIKEGQTYVVLTKDDGIVYKRLANINKKAGTVELHSDNKAYQPYQLSFLNIAEIWKYECTIKLSGYSREEINYDRILAMLRELQIEVKKVKT
jgi:transcriptional regulator with XRE-family HTH domain